ncbi:glycoside hydrolase family 2 protein [Pleomassaria siparia CBS 279.74]|uniref:Glycoside hydrolase family 2 protein n=1 Tax=Pleomassaria siparia CBS 279.74 TaxID=1314801 RepID=A0A6G1JR57_9PLEO|nr:glycoside hydrolase family 2 protein [Pleomassaria siparia CBS 279.74]
MDSTITIQRLDPGNTRPLEVVQAASLVSVVGQSASIPSWKVQSSSKTDNDVSKLSSSSLNTSSWYTIGTHGTLMASLLSNKVYTETDLFYSTNLEKVDYSQFQVPWFYRSEFSLGSPGAGSHSQLKTNGISSRADIFLNGKQVATKDVQAGAYAGLTYDVSGAVTAGLNTVLVKVYPTDYNRDFALGFVDWNPDPPDNGTGIWRDIEIKQTGPVSLSIPRVVTTLGGQVTVRLDVQSLEENGVQGEVVCKVLDPQGKELGQPRAELNIGGKAQQTVSLTLAVADPQVWWPKQWGSQPLYSTTCTTSTNSGLSDTTPSINFGIRTVTSKLNTHNDTIFSINGHPFQVLGAGYTSDIFLRFDMAKLTTQFQYMLAMGLNTLRLEGKQEHPALYALADSLGLMVLAGWECCDKWEGWTYNDEGSGVKWTTPDYTIANNSMRHEAEMMQHHPSMLAFLVGSDFWPDDRATEVYVDALKAFDWDVPIIASASQRGYPALLGNGGMKMDGPYDWVPPNYWYGDQLGAAFGFGSELGSGVGTPELESLNKFLSPTDLEDLWKTPNKGLYHMSTNVSSFHTREIYNDAVWKRYGAPASLSDYLLKAQMADYEATRAQYEAYTSRWNAERPATGLIYWMLNSAWPSLHWSLFDYYLRPAGSFYGVSIAGRLEHVLYDYQEKTVYLINRSLAASGPRKIDITLLSLAGTVLHKSTVHASTQPNTSILVRTTLTSAIDAIRDVSLLRLVLSSDENTTLSSNTYWLSAQPDLLDWNNSTWYTTPLTSYANFTSLGNMSAATVVAVSSSTGPPGKNQIALENKSSVPAVFIRLALVDEKGDHVLPVNWTDNYVTLWPGEKMQIGVEYGNGGYNNNNNNNNNKGVKVQFEGRNVEAGSVDLGPGGRE